MADTKKKQAEAERAATVEELLNRPKHTEKVYVSLNGEGDERLAITFRSIGRDKFDALLDEHTPEATEEQPNPPEDLDTFAPALVAASAIEPTISHEQAKQLYDEWNRTEYMTIYRAAVRANTKNRVRYLGKDSTETDG